MTMDTGVGRLERRGVRGLGCSIDSRAQRPVSAGRRAQATARPERRAPPPAPAPRRLRTPRRQTPGANSTHSLVEHKRPRTCHTHSQRFTSRQYPESQLLLGTPVNGKTN